MKQITQGKELRWYIHILQMVQNYTRTRFTGGGGDFDNVLGVLGDRNNGFVGEDNLLGSLMESLMTSFSI
jgi:hypothetical protein